MLRGQPRRRRLGLLSAAAALIGASVLLPTALSARADPTPPTGVTCTGAVTTTCTQNDPTHFAYIPAKKGHPGGTETVAPTVTVSQTSGLVYQTVQVAWEHFTPSFDQNGGQLVSSATYYGVGLYECTGADPQISPLSQTAPAECYAESSSTALLGQDGLGNSVTAFTAPDGSGSADITIETGTENSLLRCSLTVPCSLVVVPNWGGVQDTAKVSCTDHKDDTSNSGTGEAQLADIGDPCSWADRITVPLTFASTPAACTSAAGFSSEGSPMLEQAMTRWRPGWCNAAGGVTLNYDSGTTEPQARQDFTTPAGPLSQSTDVAFTSLPATPQQTAQRAFTYAPVANTGIVVAFVIDNPNTGQQIEHLTLDARLVAKLLTDSYSLGYSAPVCATGAPTGAQVGCGDYDNTTGTYEGHQVPCTASMPQSASCDPAVAGNPTSIVTDPEFKALNPTLFPVGAPADVSLVDLIKGQFLPILAGGDTDVTYEVTRWIESDPGARSFLAGTPDPYGMHVNSYYKDVDWPTDQLESLDPGFSDNTRFAGYGTMQVALNPVDSLDNTVQSLLASQPTDIDTGTPVPVPCNAGNQPSNPPCYFARQASESPGDRVLFAIMDAADATNFGFPTATLVNAAGVGVDADATSIAAASHDVTMDPDGITTSPSYAQLVADPAAYPMELTDYAMVPTCAASAATASSIVRFLGLASGEPGQTVGLTVGDLSPGYAPLSATQVAQTAQAASEVAAQRTCLPGHRAGTPTAASTSTSPVTGGSGGTGGSGSTDTAARPGSTGVASGPTRAHTLPPNNTVASSARYGVKAGIGAGPLAALVVLVTVGGLGLLVAGPGTWWVGSTTRGAAAFAALRRRVLR